MSSPPPRCPRIDNCPTFPLFGVQSALRMWISMYCEADFSRCERYRRGNAGENIPATLLPNGKDLRDFLPPKRA